MSPVAKHSQFGPRAAPEKKNRKKKEERAWNLVAEVKGGKEPVE